MGADDLIVAIAYFSIPIQILVSLRNYPRMTSMPLHIFILLMLFALFIFFCGAGHALRCQGKTNEDIYIIVNHLTAFVSLTTALYLMPLIPSIMSSMDEDLQSLTRLNDESEESKNKLLTFMAFY